MFTISKSFHFDYSHRVWVQKLREDFCAAGDTGTKCRFQHGHTGTVRVWVEGDDLNPQSMLCDFKELGFCKDFLDDNIDHKYILDKNDPLFEQITNGILVMGLYTVDDGKGGKTTKELPAFQIADHMCTTRSIPNSRIRCNDVTIPGTDHVTGQKLDVSSLEGVEREFFESFFFVDFVPTSENLARWVFEWCQAKLQQIDVTVSKIEWSETPKSVAVYTRP